MKLHFKALFTLGFLLIATLSYSSTPKIEFTEYTLDNGLHVILQQDNTTPNVVVNIMYHVGAKNEHPERTGFAHFFEHLMFEGSKHIDRGEFSEIVEQAGGTLNAFTSFDVTNYYILLPSNQLELGLWMESERMLHPKIDSVGIATQKSVVTEEMQQTRDNRPYGRLLIETISRAFTVHPYKGDVLGLDPHVRNATDEDIKNFHDMFYVPNNAVLVITGDIDKAETKKMVERYFGDIPAGTQEFRRPAIDAEPRRTAEVRDTVYDNVQIPMIIQAYMIPAQGTPDFYAVEMLGTLMSQGQSSRLYRRLVDQEQKALQVASIALGLEHPGINLTFALANMGTDPRDIENVFNEELEKVRNELVSEEELQKVKNQIENRMVNSNTTIARRATNLANYHLLYGDANLINTELERYMKVTREDIRRVAREYFREDNRVVLYWLPKGES
ncbi:MAG: insulinase family protein [Bacteroidetes bacterium]|nr:MAG: insulinase family protein [Bacteroidota bacterium]